MSWQSITEITEGSQYADAADKVVNRIESQLSALETFLVETEELAATDPNLAKMRADVEALYNDTVSTLEGISQEDLEGAGNFYAVGALSQISTGLQLTIDIPDPRVGGGAHFAEGVAGLDMGQVGLDESLGYPTFSLANPGGILRDQGDYNLAPTENGRWVPTGDPLAVEPEAAPQPTDPANAPTVSPHQ